MNPAAHTVARTRWALRVALRLALLVVLLLAAWTMYNEVGAYRRNVSNFRSGQVRFVGGGGPRILSSLKATPRWLMLGALLLAADLLALRLLVPMPRRGCPACGYDVDESKQDRCPECGLALRGPAGRKGTDAPDPV